ncbi:putative acetyltransferase [Klebsiella pneumoniae]|nr:putative acetyltransferase [Klebsiella pneumoniae]
MKLPLTTPRLLLRRFRTEDLPSFSHYRNLPEVARFQSWTHYGMTEATAFYEQQRSQAFAEDESWFQLAVEIQANGALAGDVGIHFLDHGRQAELGMTFSPAYQHQGYAREAMRAVMALLFEQLAHHRLTAVVDTRNTGAIQTPGRAGLSSRGALPAEYLFLKASGAMSTCTRCCVANISEVTGEPSLLPGGRLAMLADKARAPRF